MLSLSCLKIFLAQRARLRGPGMGADPAPATVAIELFRGAITAFVLTCFSPRLQGITLGELRSELDTGRCPQPAEVSVSVVNFLHAFTVVGLGLFFHRHLHRCRDRGAPQCDRCPSAYASRGDA